MRTGELVKATGVSDQTIRRLANKGIIPAKRLPIAGTHWRFAKADLGRIRAILIEAGLIEKASK